MKKQFSAMDAKTLTQAAQNRLREESLNRLITAISRYDHLDSAIEEAARDGKWELILSNTTFKIEISDWNFTVIREILEKVLGPRGFSVSVFPDGLVKIGWEKN